MTTISKAMKLSEQGGDYCIKGQLITRQIFYKPEEGRIMKLLIDVIVDQNGETFEVKSWSEKKAFTVFRKFAPNCSLQITSSAPIREPNRKYSQARGEIYSSWFAQEIDCVQIKSGVRCFTQISTYHKSSKKPANVAGLFCDLIAGPWRKNSRGRIIVQGYYLRLLDENCRLFQVLIWVNPGLEKGNRFPLKDCQADDIVLILAAREQEQRYKCKTPGHYTLTTTYPAVVNPQCLSDKTLVSLKRARQGLQSECCIAFDPLD